MKTKTLLTELDNTLTTLNDEYMNLHKQLDTHRGKPLAETDLLEANRILKEIQEKYSEIYDICLFIANRYEYACNISKSHEMFITQLIEAGAQEEVKE